MPGKALKHFAHLSLYPHNAHKLLRGELPMTRKNVTTRGIGKTLRKFGDEEAKLLKNVYKHHKSHAKGIFNSGLGLK